jgi:hypothetical protein
MLSGCENSTPAEVMNGKSFGWVLISVWNVVPANTKSFVPAVNWLGV